MPKKLYSIGHWCKLHKTFLAKFMSLGAYPEQKFKEICRQQHKLCQKSFMKLATGVSVIKLFLA
jgi:hypothetical protein